MKLSKTKLAILALICANTIWGAAPPIFKWSLHDIGPFTLAFYRFTLASIIILPFCYQNLHIKLRDWFNIFLLGFFGVTINIIFFFIGLLYAPSINASLIGNSDPIIIIFLSMWLLHEHPKHRMVVGAIIGLVGVVLIVLKPLLAHGADISILGNLFFVVAMFGSTAQAVIGKKLLKIYRATTISFWSFFIGSVTFFPLYIYEAQYKHIVTQFTNPTILGVLFGAILSSACAYFLFFWALKYLKASSVGMFLYLDPVVTVLIAIPLLHEIPDIFYVTGAILVFSGIFLAEGRVHWHPLHKLLKK